jgi:hypothetical protein
MRIGLLVVLLTVTFSNAATAWNSEYEKGRRDGYDAGVDRAAVEKEKTRRARLKELENCLRKADWPGMPGRSECQAMYGE